MRVLLTGGTSLLGQATVHALLDRGDDVTVLQRRPSRLPCAQIRGDVADAALVFQAARHRDAVVHLAAKVDVTGPWSDYVASNIVGTRNVVAACRDGGVRRLVHVSTPSVAHSGRALVGAGAGPAEPDRARGHYARSKAVAELIALAADAPNLAVLAIRPHLVWGPGDTQLVERAVDRGRRGRLPLVGSGAGLIDTTYLDNAATALVAAVDADVHGEALVVSNGEPRPMAEMLYRLCEAAGVPGPRGRVPYGVAWLAGAAVEQVWRARRRPGATPPMTRFLAEQMATAHWFDQRRTRDVLRWTPQVSLDEGFSRLTDWYASGRAAGATSR
jgi:2-alkyl-3-oxoalkanoate reductase